MPWESYVIFAFFGVCFAISVYRLRRNGPGPAVNYIPKAFRPRMNALYRRNGWQEPFDEDGDRNPFRDGI